MTKRIYVVSDAGAKQEAECLVRASSPSQAVGFVVRERYNAEVATQEKLVELISSGTKVQEVGGDE